MQLELGTVLRIPRGTPGLEPLQLELGELLSYERRQKEAVYVNKETAPELMHVFNMGYAASFKLMKQISFEHTLALTNANRRKSVVLLDVAPEILTKKGLVNKRSPGGSEDLRKAVLEQDEEYLRLMNTAHVLEAAHEYLRGKAKSFEMSYHAVKKVFDNTNSRLGNVNNLSGGFDPSPLTIGEPKYE